MPTARLSARLALREALDREQAVAVPGRLLEPLVGGRLAHAALELPADRPRLAGEELDDPVDDRPVVLLGDCADARRRAPLDVEVEARDPGVTAGLRPLARSELEDPVEDVERLAHLLRVRVRAEVDRAAPMPLAREHDPRIGVGDRDGDVRERLVVAQADVERRPVALDEVLLEVQRLRLALGDDHLDALDAVDHPVDADAHVAAAVEVAADARPERLRLADVEDVVPLAAKEIDARAARQLAELAPNGIFMHES